MNHNSPFEKSRWKDRIKEISTLAAFTIAIGAVSIVVMNLIAYPVAVFAVKQKNAFNLIFKYLFAIGIIVLLAYLITATVYRLKKGGLSGKEITLYITRKYIYSISMFFLIIAASAAVIALLYILFSNNYYLLYKIAK
jgi:hypothetical protein